MYLRIAKDMTESIFNDDRAYLFGQQGVWRRRGDAASALCVFKNSFFD
jgi:hypothetical protein